MAIGRTFREAFQKALRSLELDLDGWESRSSGRDLDQLQKDLASPNQGRLVDLHEAFRRGLEPELLHRVTGIDPWFLDNLERLMEVEGRLRGFGLICPLHGASFDCRSGAVLGAPASKPLACWQVKVEGQRVLVAPPVA